MDGRTEAERVLALVVQGCLVGCHEDRYVVVENPDHRPDDGSDPFLCRDAGAGDEGPST